MTDRRQIIANFLAGTAWQDWRQTALAGDASARRYLRLSSGPETVILMDAPPENGEETKPFVEIATFLQAHGFAAPEILAQDASSGLLVISDLGTGDFAQWLRDRPSDEAKLYRSAVDILLRLEGVTPPPHLKRLTPAVGAEMIAIVGPYYSHQPTDELCTAVEHAMAEFAPEPSVLALRDYHAENLIWRVNEPALHRVGLLDFQDAFIAPPGYDLASLLRDARRDVGASVAAEMIAHFAEHTRATGPFRTLLACLGVQRNLRILGVFARLATEGSKPRYLDLMPRVWGHVLADLKDPALSRLKETVLDTVPAPTPEKRAELAA